jgi:hypothetical protein
MLVVLLVIAAGAFVYAIGVFLVVAVVWLFTTWVGLFIVIAFLLAVVGNLMDPPDDEDEEE